MQIIIYHFDSFSGKKVSVTVQEKEFPDGTASPPRPPAYYFHGIPNKTASLKILRTAELSFHNTPPRASGPVRATQYGKKESSHERSNQRFRTPPPRNPAAMRAIPPWPPYQILEASYNSGGSIRGGVRVAPFRLGQRLYGNVLRFLFILLYAVIVRSHVLIENFHV